MTTSMFKKCDNDDGYITVVVLRDRYLDDMKKDGWVRSPAEFTEEPIEVVSIEPARETYKLKKKSKK